MIVKTFEEFVNENYLDSQPSPEYLKYDFDKMKENGYISVELLKSVDGVDEGTKLMTSSNEFGTLDDDSLVTCYSKDGDEIMVVKSDLKVNDEPKKDKKSEKK